MPSPQYIVNRYLFATVEFNNLNDLETFLWKEGKALGWTRTFKDNDRTTFVKKYYGFWMCIYWHTPTYTLTNITIAPLKYPPIDSTLSGKEWDTAWNQTYEACTSKLDIKGKSLSDIEREVQRVAQVTKDLIVKSRVQSRQRQKALPIEWEGYEGKEALEKWQERIEELVVELLDKQIHTVDPYMTTADLILFIMKENTGGYELGYPSSFTKDQAARAFQRILENLAKQGKIRKVPPKHWVSRLVS